MCSVTSLNKQYEQRTDYARVWVVLLSVLLLLKWLGQIWILCSLHIPGRVNGRTANTKCQNVQMSCDTARMFGTRSKKLMLYGRCTGTGTGVLLQRLRVYRG